MNEETLPAATLGTRLAAACVRRLPLARYRVLDWLARRARAPFLMSTPTETGGFVYRCDLRDSIAREVCFTGMYGPQETLLLRHLLRPGMTFVDVGANWGYFTLLGAQRVGPTGRVVSLEPDPRLFRVLNANLGRNGIRHALPLNVAAASEAGTLTLEGYSEDSGNFGLSRITDRPTAGSPAYSVEADTIDHLLFEHEVGVVHLLKMDIEGAEGFALEGLRESLAAGRVERILVELHPVQLGEHGRSVDDLVALMQAAGFRGYTVDHSPATTRAAAYGGVTSAASLLRPLERGADLDAWPHQLWLAPGVAA